MRPVPCDSISGGLKPGGTTSIKLNIPLSPLRFRIVPRPSALFRRTSRARARVCVCVCVTACRYFSPIFFIVVEHKMLFSVAESNMESAARCVSPLPAGQQAARTSTRGIRVDT